MLSFTISSFITFHFFYSLLFLPKQNKINTKDSTFIYNNNYRVSTTCSARGLFAPSIIGYFYVSLILAKHTCAFVIIFPS